MCCPVNPGWDLLAPPDAGVQEAPSSSAPWSNQMDKPDYKPPPLLSQDAQGSQAPPGAAGSSDVAYLEEGISRGGLKKHQHDSGRRPTDGRTVVVRYHTLSCFRFAWSIDIIYRT